MKVLVTGASGFLGSHVAEQLAREGHDVRALVRRSSNRKFLETLPRIEFAYGSVEDAGAVDEAVKGVDAIVHSAGLVKARSADEFFATNTRGTENMINAAKKSAPKLKRFVFVSSLTVAGPSHDGKPVLVGRETSPVSHYGRSKRAAEAVVLAAKDELPVTILRPAAIYGPRDSEIFLFFQSIARGVLATVGGTESTISMVYATDCADACVRAITTDVPSGSIYFVDDGTPYPFKVMFEAVEKALGKRARIRFNFPMPVVYAAALGSEIYGKLTNKAVMLTRDKLNEIRQPHWVCDSQTTMRDLGWTPKVKIEEGTKLAADWYRANNWL